MLVFGINHNRFVNWELLAVDAQNLALAPFLVHCWRNAIYGEIFFRLISYPVIVRRRHKIPSPGIYLTFVMAMTTVSVIMTVMVLNFFYRGPVLTEVPPWVRK